MGGLRGLGVGGLGMGSPDPLRGCADGWVREGVSRQESEVGMIITSVHKRRLGL